MNTKASHDSNQTPSSLEECGETSPPGYHHADPFLYRILEEEAKRMRRFPTEAESILWETVRKKQLGFRFRRQFVIYDYIVDFVCLPLKLIIEADGKYHFTEEKKAADSVRNDFLIGKGFSLLRFMNQEILANIEQVKYKIIEKMEELRSKTTAVGGGNQTTPPPPGGGGGGGGALFLYSVGY